MTPDEFKRVRSQWGLTQQQMADRLGVSRLSIGHWESGQNRVPTVVVKLVDAYRCLPCPAPSQSLPPAQGSR
jgi:DNA-binding XRE family transcriptional regulator